ncbi:Xin actin-binding repeat-containing protein 1 [Larimichthys crocea]|uniref:Uncharacterized protein n=1 Tax=Larimichthys crocea TaxID=215358 RepID=A0ACD3QSK7_LARCR|nr:Xin actin-binding repeat-containing protein 1 [Larimichthys crocea]
MFVFLQMPANQDLSKVTCEGQPSITTQNSTPNPVANGNSKSSTSESVTAPPLPQKTSEKLQKQKPALPPKPQWTKSVVVEEQNISATSAPEVARPIEDNIKRAMIPSEQSQLFPSPSTDKLQETTCAKISNKTLHETYHQNYVEEAVQDLNQTFECLPMDSKSEEIKTKKKTAPLTGSKSDCQVTMSNSSAVEMEKNVIQKINAVEEIQMCMKKYAEAGKHEMNMSLKAALQNFERKESESLDKRAPVLSKTVKVINDNVQ